MNRLLLLATISALLAAPYCGPQTPPQQPPPSIPDLPQSQLHLARSR